MRDVAARAGVSAMTVSRVLKGSGRVGDSTRQRVLDAVSDLGYRRNETARNLRLGRQSGLVGLVVTNLANPFYAQLALGAEEVVQEHGLRLVLGNTAEQLAREQDLVQDLVSRRANGLIVVPSGSDQQHLSPAALDSTPLVLAARPPAGIEADTVLVDDFGGARAATARLVADGHTRVGFLGNPPTLFTGAERFRGWWSALEEAGIQPRDTWVRRGPYDVVTAEAAARELLDRADGPTAVFCANNRLTLGACRAVRGLGSAAALGGFDAVESADLLGVPLTLASYDPAEIGRRAARLLMDRVSDDPGARPTGPPRRTIIPTSLAEFTA
ncbi:LacI family transcriptional regulator [Streptomyces triticagri]|uniref:LacI family transcriptional regulator n=1 Tax=Streptomyces triticagri TaxID=2293568 RepID=A0A372M856_9ACTN|nr:LacI family DNA-binding transcriptional regulator [Streptomyces triticagri]RFU87134.1 LacI family transcriptional regulator [Streptomyces triticagri]